MNALALRMSHRAPLRWAALGYSAAWLIGLAIPVAMVDVDDSGAAALQALSGEGTAMVARSALVHGLAALMLLAVVAALAAHSSRAGRWVTAAGSTAVVLSLVQLGLAARQASAVSASDAGAVGALGDAINRLDGVKMLALVALVALVLAGVRELPRWHRVLGVVLVAVTLPAAAGYLLLEQGLATFAFASLPLLLVWVTAAGVSLARRAR